MILVRTVAVQSTQESSQGLVVCHLCCSGLLLGCLILYDTIQDVARSDRPDPMPHIRGPFKRRHVVCRDGVRLEGALSIARRRQYFNPRMLRREANYHRAQHSPSRCLDGLQETLALQREEVCMDEPELPISFIAWATMVRSNVVHSGILHPIWAASSSHVLRTDSSTTVSSPLPNGDCFPSAANALASRSDKVSPMGPSPFT